ncbi:MAG: hypothetical protein M1832_003912 [Thelocarpon impressellum]|nr:MAG: hypothetical protein M1832_003912 [Thelocarpon impressellum]
MTIKDPLKQHPQLSLHLSDTTPVALLSSAASSDNASSQNNKTKADKSAARSALTALTTTYLTAHDVASSLTLGRPKRFTAVTDSGTVLVQSYIPPPPAPGAEDEQQVETAMPSGRRASVADALAVNGAGAASDTAEARLPPPALVATVVAPDEACLGECNQAVLELEAVGRGFQSAWAREQDERDEVETRGAS